MHASKLTAAIACPMRGFYEFILEKPAGTNPIAVFGQALHYLFKRFFTHHPSTKRFPYDDPKKLRGQWFIYWWSAVAASGASPAALQRWTDFFRTCEAAGRKFHPPQPHGFGSFSENPASVAWESDEQPDKLYLRGVGILTKFFNEFNSVRNDGTKRIVERRFSFSWHGLTLSGIIDRLDIEVDGVVLLDYKLDHYAPHLLETGIQLTIYQLAYEAYFRKKLPGRPPLKAIRIYSYQSGKMQEAPLRTPKEFGMLLAMLLEASSYYQQVLTGELPAPARHVIFRLFDPGDAARGDITPRLPRGDHCRYCLYFRECRAWENGEAPNARTLFQQKFAIQRALDTPRELPLPFDGVPAIERGSASYQAMLAERTIEQLDFKLFKS